MKAFVIYLEEREHSKRSSRDVISALLSYGIDAELFPGIPGDQATKMAAKGHKTLYPHGIKNRELSNEEILNFIKPELQKEFSAGYFSKVYERHGVGDDAGKMSTPGVIGCFMSHYALWQKCVDLNEPIMIFEDDVKFYRNFEPIEWDDILILALGKQTYLHDPWKTYLENPTGIPQALTWRNFSMPGCVGYAIKPDAARRLIKTYRPYWYPTDNAINSFVCQIQIASYQMGRTTLPDEGNISSIRTKSW
jgi:GR25 family glycosyltransferase involved in LPS biosynthesis